MVIFGGYLWPTDISHSPFLNLITTFLGSAVSFIDRTWDFHASTIAMVLNGLLIYLISTLLCDRSDKPWIQANTVQQIPGFIERLMVNVSLILILYL